MLTPLVSDARQPLRVGFLLDSLIVPAWMALAIERVRASKCAQVELVVAGKAGVNPAASHGFADKARVALERWAVDAPRGDRDAFTPVDVSALVSGVPLLEAARGDSGAPGAEYSAANVDEIRTHELDVLVDLGSRQLAGEILQSAVYGVWSYSKSDAPPAFWELAERRSEISTALELVTADGRKTLYGSSSSIDRTSVATSRNRCYWKAASFVARTLKALDRDGGEPFLRAAKALPAAAPAPRRPRIPELAGFATMRSLEKRMSRALRRFSREQWILLYAFGATPPQDYRAFRPLIPPRDRFWADPHVVASEGRHYVFIEEYLYATDRGHISVFTLDADGRYEPPVPIIEKPYHLSYPHIFKWRGDFYLVPESKQNRTIEVYRCTRFPDVWEPAAVLMEDVEAVDATLLEHGGRWWLFVNMVENKGASSWDELFLFSSDSPLSRHWVPHPLNPIISDVKRSRPAGPIFRHDGRLYRPSQDCSRWYGYGFNIGEITELTLTDYSERIVERVEPNWDPRIFATHTLAFDQGLTVIDGMRRFWRLPGGRK